ncbi:hypothetical protein GGX14DRAFT_406658 [Mycena pura]|uniref:Uncharacterized protein n=1 Tax=Mycena pura TaxID=153505 RepID=A0AAD6UQ08_9AGAR|nr:hypothetical protein GGX14DRAFT_406658 [Mycena pura]
MERTPQGTREIRVMARRPKPTMKVSAKVNVPVQQTFHKKKKTKKQCHGRSGLTDTASAAAVDLIHKKKFGDAQIWRSLLGKVGLSNKVQSSPMGCTLKLSRPDGSAAAPAYAHGRRRTTLGSRRSRGDLGPLVRMWVTSQRTGSGPCIGSGTAARARAPRSAKLATLAGVVISGLSGRASRIFYKYLLDITKITKTTYGIYWKELA